MRFFILGLLLTVFFLDFAGAQEGPDFVYQTLNGESAHLQDLTSRGPTLIAFWATWCTPCKQELRTLQSLYTRYHERGFNVLAVNQDSPRSLAKVRSYVSSQEFSFDVALDPNGQLLQRWNAQNIPFSVLLDEKGTVLYQSLGYLPGDERKLENALQDHLDRSP
jgi:peroxiredoxin